jgi:hypothetical protein
MFVPPLSRDYVSLNESFISNNYGVSVNRVDGNRKVTWSARRARATRPVLPPGADQALQRRKTKKRPDLPRQHRRRRPGENRRRSPARADPPALGRRRDLHRRSHQARQQPQRRQRQAAAGRRHQPDKRSIVELLLSIAHVPVEKVHTIRLVADQPQTPELWLRSFNGNDWLYFNPETGEQGLPTDRLLWWTGDET